MPNITRRQQEDIMAAKFENGMDVLTFVTNFNGCAVGIRTTLSLEPHVLSCRNIVCRLDRTAKVVDSLGQTDSCTSLVAFDAVNKPYLSHSDRNATGQDARQRRTRGKIEISHLRPLRHKVRNPNPAMPKTEVQPAKIQARQVWSSMYAVLSFIGCKYISA